MNRHSHEFPHIEIPEQFHSIMFSDVSCKNDCCPSFVFSDSVLDDEHEIKVWVDHEDFGQRKSMAEKQFTVFRQTAIFPPELIFETDDLNEFFHWGLKSMHFEMLLLSKFKIIHRSHDEIGILNKLPNPGGLDEELFQLIHHKNVFVLIKSDGYIELREFVNGEDREVDRKYRNTNLIEVLHKIDRCKDCGKLFFEKGCEVCNAKN